MTVELNHAAVTFAKRMIRGGHVIRDDRDGGPAHSPTADQEDRFLKRETWEVYGNWHLGIDADAAEQTKERYEFAIGDLRNVRRSAIVAIESRAADHDHDDIAQTARRLLELMDNG